MADARVYPPSEQRLAEARRQGHLPRAALVGVAGPFVAFAWWAPRAAESLAHELLGLWQAAFSELAQGRTPKVEPLLRQGADLVLSTLAPGFALMLAATVLGLWLLQGVTWGFPRAPARPRFTRLRRDATAPLLFVALLSAMYLGGLSSAFRAESATLGDQIAVWLSASALALLVCAAVDAAFARARHVRSLWLTRREQQDELREAFGSPELRSERARRRRSAFARREG